MIDVTVSTRVVVVLGRGRLEVAAAAYVDRAAELGVPLLVVTVGYPVSEPQRDFVAEAIEEAFEARVSLDAILLPRAAELATHLTLEDEVAMCAEGKERRRIGAVLARLRP